ncbi:hypothetical protein DLM86_17065 [Paenibacillus flagellatus]|uniref:Uncharacterized protein n=1 Tax=Paenibacillus flagellatus TaxID=2211139 RepID=A0A2V5K463_9BACL|nr:hypothetical protein DLM86_17065 [Paenibacillus flagellatus]
MRKWDADEHEGDPDGVPCASKRESEKVCAADAERVYGTGAPPVGAYEDGGEDGSLTGPGQTEPGDRGGCLARPDRRGFRGRPPRGRQVREERKGRAGLRAEKGPRGCKALEAHRAGPAPAARAARPVPSGRKGRKAYRGRSSSLRLRSSPEGDAISTSPIRTWT